MPAPPPELADLLEKTRPALKDIGHVLATEEAPVWEIDLEKTLEAPALTLGHFELLRLLALTATEAVRTGRTEEALRVLEASWRLDGAVLERPDILSQMIGQAGLKSMAPVLRCLCSVPPIWQQRLAEIDLRTGILQALRLEGWLALHAATSDYVWKTWQKDDESWWLKLPPRYARPIMRLVMLDHAEMMEDSVVEIEQRDLRTFDPKAFFEKHYATVPRWNIVARITVPDLYDAWVKAGRLELSLELTSRTLEVRRLLAEGTEAEKESVAGRFPSRVAGLSWIYHAEPASITISLDGDLAHQVQKAVPLEVVISRSECMRGGVGSGSSRRR